MDKRYSELEALQDGMSPVLPEDEQPFKLRYSNGFALLGLMGGGLGMGILFLVPKAESSMMIITGFFFPASVILFGSLLYYGFWSCEVNFKCLTVRWMFYRKVILWCSVHSAKWLVNAARMDATYTPVLFDRRKKLPAPDSNAVGLRCLKNTVRSKRIPLCRKACSFRDVHHPEV